jgi:hemoglobin
MIARDGSGCVAPSRADSSIEASAGAGISPSLRGRRTLEVIRRCVSPYENAKDDQNRVNAVEFEEVPMATQDSPSLYDRLGGVYSIATVMDDFIDRIMVDPRLNANTRVDEAHHRVSPAGFKYLVTEMVCWATGGPQKYTGRSMKDSHQHLMITATEWEAFLDDLQQTLDKFAVPQAEQAEIKAIVASTRADIVV